MVNSKVNNVVLVIFIFFIPLYALNNSRVILRDIRLKGEFPLFESNIRDAISIMSGDSVDNNILEEQKKNIEEYLKREGYNKTEINIEKTFNEKEKYLDILIRLKKGKRIKMGDIEFEGNSYFSDFKLAFRYNIWDYFLFPTGIGRGYNENDLSKNLKELLLFYRNSGFPECRIRQEVSLDTMKFRNNVIVYIDEGPRYKWDYSSKYPFRRDEIQKAFDFSKRGNFRDVALNRGVKSLEDKLIDWGYEDPIIKIVDTTLFENENKIRFITPQIFVQKRIKIIDLEIRGVNSLQLNNIKKLMWLSENGPKRKGKGFYSKYNFQEDLKTIKNFYRTEGFFKTSINSNINLLNDSTECNIVIDISEGEPTIIDSINISGADNIELHSNLNGQITKGARFKEKYIDGLVKKYAANISEQGYPFVNVLCDISFNSDSSRVNVNVVIDKGEFKKIGNVYFSGNFRTSENYLIKESELVKQQPYISSKISKSMSLIRNTSLFERVYYQTKSDSVDSSITDIKIFLSEMEALKLNGAFGYETENGAYLKFGASNSNIFGYNKSLILSGILSPKERYFGLRYVEPDFIFKKSSLWINLYFKTDESLNRTVVSRKLGNSYGIAKKFLKQSEISLGISYERRKQISSTNISDTSNISLSDDARHVLSFKPQISLDGRDSFIRPHRGGYSLIQGDLSNGLLSSNTDDYFNMAIDLRAYLPIFKNLIVASRIRGEGITPYGKSDSIAVDQLLSIGGNSSVRGYSNDLLYKTSTGKSMPGFITINSNLELRLEFAKFFEALLFFDGGSLSPKADIKSLQKPRFSIGPGLSVLTPIGPIGLSYGFKLKREEDEKLGALHFSIGYIF